MDFHYNIYSVTLMMSGVAAFFLSLLIFRRLGETIQWFSILMMCSAVWAICYALELASYTLPQMLFWINLEYIGISFLPAAWMIFILKFLGKEEWMTYRNIILLFLFPTITLLLVWTNPSHHLHYESTSLYTGGPFPLLSINPGVWYRIHTVYFYFLLALGLYLLLNKFRKADPIYKKQNILIVVGAFIPWSVNFLYLLGLRPYGHIDLTPHAFIVTSIVLSFGLLRFKLFDILPLAREKVLEEMREGVLVLDQFNRIVDLNPAMRRFLPGKHQSDIIGKDIDIVFGADSPIARAIENPANETLEISLPHRNEERIFEVTITPLTETRSSYNGVALTFWDITERKRAEETLKAQAEELLALNQLKDQLFSIVSHDLRSPLASLVDMLNAAEDGDISEEEFKSFLPALSKNIGHTSTLLENLLYWSKSQLKGEAVSMETFDLKTLTQSKLAFFEKKALEKNIRIEDCVGKNTYLLADKHMVDLVLRNLIGNAIKFCNANDTISISAQVDAATTTVCISDTGVGMDNEMLNKLFSSELVTTAGTNDERGTGLGLKLCKDFIEKNNGRIWAESSTGKGSRFYFQLNNK